MTITTPGSSTQKFFLFLLIAFTLFSFPRVSLSAQTPDAGQLLREQPKAPMPMPGAPNAIGPAAPAEPTTKDFGPKFVVKGFHVEGATLIPEAELVAQLQDGIGKELSFFKLQALAARLTHYYREKGFVARVIVPPQEVQDGIVTLKVIEGQRGNVNIDNKGVRLDPDRVQAFIDYRLKQGDKLDLDKLHEALAILNEQPGISVTSRMATGAEESDVDLAVTAEDTPLSTIQLAVNNQGSRGTGEPQVFGNVIFNDPLGRFDAASVMVNASEGSRFLRGEYSVAIGNSGLRASVNASGLDYDITQDSLSALDARGNALTGGVGLSYPLIRGKDLNLSLSGSYDHKILHDYTVAGQTDARSIEAFSIGVSGTRFDKFIGGGQTGFGLTLGSGDISIDNAAAKATDLTSRNTNGGYGKLSYQLSRDQRLLGPWSLSASFSGQFAADNLDSTERFVLGGPSGVRAYPVGEATGDEGCLASLNLIYRFSNTLSASTFIDGGLIRLNKHTWANWNASNPQLENSYGLSGAGFAVNWLVAGKFALNATVAAPIGSNDGRDSNGGNNDGSNPHDVRGWLGLATSF